jgi:hypothetical protein
MKADRFRNELGTYLEKFKSILSMESGDWTVKGFIDIYRNIYTISKDTKVISKVIELMLFPVLSQFAAAQKYKMILCEHQNHYPDITFMAEDNTKFALDLKSTYRIGPNTVNGFTLGAFTGYFRKRDLTKNIRFPYKDYRGHFVLGIMYSRNRPDDNEQVIYKLDDLLSIASVAKDFTFLLQEKWRIASDQPGSGNTKNIGSVKNVDALIKGKGPFLSLGEGVFDDYWMSYLTGDMARSIDSRRPYKNLAEYLRWRRKGKKTK